MAIKIEPVKKLGKTNAQDSGRPNSKTNASQSSQMSDLLTKEITLFGSAFNSVQKEAWYDELHVLLTSGINLKNALELLVETQKKEKLRKLNESILTELVSGTSFSDILQQKKEFTQYEYFAIRIGERTGQLDRIAKELSEFFRRKNEQRREITSALTYPVIVLCTALLVVGFMLKYVVPMFADIFKQNQVELPKITRGIVYFSELVSSHGWLILLGIILFIVGVYYAFKQLWFQKIWNQLQLKLPVLGEYVRRIYMAQSVQALALLTSSKVPIVDSMQLVAQMVKFHPLQQALQVVSKDVVKGDRLSQAFAKHRIFDKKMLALIRVAEETNQTEYIFTKLSEQYNHQVKNQSQTIGNVLNPILTILVGILVGIILVAMYLPMFRLSSIIG